MKTNRLIALIFALAVPAGLFAQAAEVRVNRVGQHPENPAKTLEVTSVPPPVPEPEPEPEHAPDLARAAALKNPYGAPLGAPMVARRVKQDERARDEARRGVDETPK